MVSRPRWRLCDRRIRTKLAMIIAIPIIAILALTVLNINSTRASANRSAQAHSMVTLGKISSEVTNRLQNERIAAALVFAGGTTKIDEFRTNVRLTDVAVADFRAQRKQVTPSDELAPVLRRIDSELVDLSLLRQQVQASSDAIASASIFLYRAIIADLITFRSMLSQTAGISPATANEIRASTTLTQAIEALGSLQTIVSRVFASHKLTPANQQEIIAASAAYTEATQSFLLLSPPAWVSYHNGMVNGPKIVDAERLIGIITRASPGEIPALGTDADGWAAAVGERMNFMHKVEAHINDQLIEDVARQRDDAWRSMLTVFALVGLGLLIIAVVGWWVTHSLVHSLTALRLGADTIANVRLPNMVNQLESEHSPIESIETLIRETIDPLHIDGRDEVGQVAAAFGVVSGRAIRIAAEQATLRADIRAIFMSLSRRLQKRVDIVVASLDKAQQGEEDSERLKRLFDIDHKVTQFRRVIASLQVQAGGRAGLSRPEPIALTDVLRAAQGEIEHYTRVEFPIVDQDVRLVGDVAEEFIHLLSEIIDNATRFSPPHESVTVEARRVGDRLYVHIQDRGTGMKQEQLAIARDQLAHPGRLNRQAAERMGIPVISAIAHRLGVAVDLHSTLGQGTRVVLTAPPSILAKEPQGSASRSQRPALPSSLPSPDTASPIPTPYAVSTPPQWPLSVTETTKPVEPRIFQELEHTWFTRPVPGMEPPTVGPQWQEAARAAAAVLDPPITTKTTGSGLPIRAPGAHVVPMVASKPTNSPTTVPRTNRPVSAVRRRDPDEVRRRTAAFQHGLGTAGRVSHPSSRPVKE